MLALNSVHLQCLDEMLCKFHGLSKCLLNSSIEFIFFFSFFLLQTNLGKYLKFIVCKFGLFANSFHETKMKFSDYYQFYL